MGTPGNLLAYTRGEEGESGAMLAKRRDLQIAGEDETISSAKFGKFGTESAKFTYVIPAGMVVVMMCGETGDNFDSESLGG